MPQTMFEMALLAMIFLGDDQIKRPKFNEDQKLKLLHVIDQICHQTLKIFVHEKGSFLILCHKISLTKKRHHRCAMVDPIKQFHINSGT